MTRLLRHLGRLLLLAVMTDLLVGGRPAAAQSSSGGPAASVARVISVRGTATRTQKKGGPTAALIRGTQLDLADTISTGRDSAVRVLSADRSVIDIGSSTSVSIGDIVVTPRRRSVSIRLTVGRIWARVTDLFGGGSKFHIDTETAIAGVRGTELIVEAGEDGTTVVTVVRGKVEVSSISGELHETIEAMMSATFDGTGRIVVGRVDAARIEAIARELGPRPELAERDVGALRDLARNVNTGAGAGHGRIDPARLDIIDSPAPPLDDEPGGFSAVDVTGRVDIRE